MAATIHYLVPRDARVVPLDGFTLRLVRGARWELRNATAYGREYVIRSWPRTRQREAIEHCYRLNGFPPNEVEATVAQFR